MANENTILTALGLDVTQFEKGSDKATQSIKPLLGAISKVDTELRKIPLLGDVYAFTFGRIAEGFAETTLQAREFSRIMETDVTKSLEGTKQQVDDINGSIHDLKLGSFSRSISDAVSDFKNTFQKGKGNGTGILGFFSGLGGIGTAMTKKDIVETEAEKRAKSINTLENRRTTLLVKNLELVQDEANARSSIAAGSEQESERLRLRLDYENKILDAEKEARQQGGPDRAKWEDAIVNRLNAQKQIYKEIYTREQDAMESRFTIRQEELSSAVKIAQIEVTAYQHGLNSQKTRLLISQEEVRLANRRYELALKTGTAEEQTAASSILKVTQAQQKLAQMIEGLRQYELGGRGRANERREQRRAARRQRVVQSRLNERGLDQRIQDGNGSLNTGGLRSGGLSSGSLARPKNVSLKEPNIPPLSETQQFRQKILEALSK